MLIRKRQNPLDYSLCCQTVTVYHREGFRREVVRAYYDYRRKETVEAGAVGADVEFLLIIPGPAELAPGDKAVPGEGPALAGKEDWSALSADRMPGLGLVKTVRPRYWQGQVCHVEARG